MTHKKYPDPYSPKVLRSDDQDYGPNYYPSVAMFLERASQHQPESTEQVHQINSRQVVSTPLISTNDLSVTENNQDKPSRPISILRHQQDDPTYLTESERVLGTSPPKHSKSPLQDPNFCRNFLGAGTTRGQSSRRDATEVKSKKRVKRGKKIDGEIEGGKVTERGKRRVIFRNIKTKMDDDQLNTEGLKGQNQKGNGEKNENENQNRAVGGKTEKAAGDDHEWETTSGSEADESSLGPYFPMD